MIYRFFFRGRNQRFDAYCFARQNLLYIQDDKLYIIHSKKIIFKMILNQHIEYIMLDGSLQETYWHLFIKICFFLKIIPSPLNLVYYKQRRERYFLLFQEGE